MGCKPYCHLYNSSKALRLHKALTFTINGHYADKPVIQNPQLKKLADFVGAKFYYPLPDWHYGFLPGAVSSEHIRLLFSFFILLVLVFGTVQ